MPHENFLIIFLISVQVRICWGFLFLCENPFGTLTYFSLFCNICKFRWKKKIIEELPHDHLLQNTDFSPLQTTAAKIYVLPPSWLI